MTKPTKWFVCPAKTQISIFTVHMKKAWFLSYPLSAQRRLRSDWLDAQTDLSLRWAQRSFCWFCHEVAQWWFPKYQPVWIYKFILLLLCFIRWPQVISAAGNQITPPMCLIIVHRETVPDEAHQFWSDSRLVANFRWAWFPVFITHLEA